MRRDRMLGGPRKSYGLSLPTDLYQRMSHFAARNRRTVSAEMQLAIEHYLEKNGLWSAPVVESFEGVVKPPSKKKKTKPEASHDLPQE